MGADVVIDTREISVEEYAKQSGTLFAAVLECSAAPGAFNEALAVHRAWRHRASRWR